jgi:hypothetical protein
LKVCQICATSSGAKVVIAIRTSVFFYGVCFVVRDC